MEDEDETVEIDGGDDQALSVDEATSAYLNAQDTEAEDGQSDLDDEETEDVESDVDPEAEGQSENEDSDEPETEGGRFVADNAKVRLPDGTVLTVGELRNGNLRDRDYRQKTMGLAEDRRKMEAQSSELKASQQQIEKERQYLTQLLEAVQPKAPDAVLLQSDPIAYMQQKENYDRFSQHLNYIRGQQQQVEQQKAKEAQTRRKQVAALAWNKLKEAVPELTKPDKLKSFSNDIKSTAAAYGYSDKEIAQTVPFDHRMALVLRDASKWRRLQASKPKAKEQLKGKPPVQKAGKRTSPDASRAKSASDAMERLKSSGSVDDAAAAYLALSQKR